MVQALAKGKEPEKLDAWIWAVVHNRWARWAAKKYYKAPEQVDIQEYEQLLPSEQCLEEEYIHSQELLRIRRELAFVRSDYRQILVTHYFEEMSVSEISRRFGIPVGTVKTRLQSGRRILKEGMNMARQFGTRSFQPEMISFSSSGKHTSGLPWSAVSRKLPVNILCEANNNPSTVEELSMELGVAMPYMEEEVEILVEAELLRKLEGDRYLTNFFISPKECQDEINELSCQFAERHYKDIWALAGKVLERAGDYGVQSSVVSQMDAQAYFAFYLEQWLVYDALPPGPGIYQKFHRKDGGNWGLIGKEQGAFCRLSRMFFNNSCCTLKAGDLDVEWYGFQCYDVLYYGERLYKREVPKSDSLGLINKFAKGCSSEELSVAESLILDDLLEQGFCVRSSLGEIRVAAVIFGDDTAQKCREYYCSLPEYQKLLEEMNRYMLEVREIVARYSVPYLKEDFEYYVGMSVDMRSIYAMLWKDSGLYSGGHAQFMAFYC